MSDTTATVRSIVTKVSRSLSDQCPGDEFTTFTQEDLVGFLNDAICQIHALRPDAFATVTNITLQDGECQELSDEFMTVVEIDGVTPEDVDAESQSTADVLKHFRKAPCLTAAALMGKYAVSSFTLNPVVPSAFTVSPEVPSGETPRVKATVIKSPTRFCADDLDAALGIPCQYESAICDWMLSRAHGVEAESDTNALNLMQFYRDGFYNTFNVNYRQAQRFGSGYYLGREGDGDEQFRNR